MNPSDLQSLLDGLDREKAKLTERLSEIERDRRQLIEQMAQFQQLAAKYNLGGTPATYVPPPSNGFNGSLKSLCHAYLTDARSPIHALRHATRQHYGSLLKRIEETFGDVSVGDLTIDQINRMHDLWSDNGVKMPMAHAVITMLRTLGVFGAEVLKDERCQKLSYILHRMKFTLPPSSTADITEVQAAMIIAKANEEGLVTLGLAQALQFCTPLRQKDCIGEWVPLTEGEPSDIISRDTKWVRGLRWEQIDSQMILHHATSKEGVGLKINLNNHPMVLNQFKKVFPLAKGPVLINYNTRLPWRAAEFRRQWRRIARLCEIPDEVKNRDSGTFDISEVA